MVVSILLLIFSFATQVIKLHKPLSDLVVVRLRAYLSTTYREFLRKAYIWSGTDTDPRHWRRTLVYQPYFVVFIVVQLLLDIYSSMLSEVSKHQITSLVDFIRYSN
jgi:hypothetical protein